MKLEESTVESSIILRSLDHTSEVLMSPSDEKAGLGVTVNFITSHSLITTTILTHIVVTASCVPTPYPKQSIFVLCFSYSEIQVSLKAILCVREHTLRGIKMKYNGNNVALARLTRPNCR